MIVLTSEKLIHSLDTHNLKPKYKSRGSIRGIASPQKRFA